MKALIQRVRQARVEVAGEVVGAIDQGLLVLVGVEREDDHARADKLLHKLLNYRVFSDEQGKMNRSLKDIDGGLLLVSFLRRRPTSARRSALRLPAGPGPPAASTGGLRAFRRRDAGASGQRRSGDLSPRKLTRVNQCRTGSRSFSRSQVIAYSRSCTVW